MKVKYFTCIEWGFNPSFNTQYSKCSIRYANKDDEEYDGYNVIGRGGEEGIEIFISDNLEDAIINAGYNPDYIDFSALDASDIELKTDILKNYIWSEEKGLKKVKLI